MFFIQKEHFIINLYIYVIFSDGDKSIPDIMPLFITIDPARDTEKAIAEYVKGMLLFLAKMEGMSQIALITVNKAGEWRTHPK